MNLRIDPVIWKVKNLLHTCTSSANDHYLRRKADKGFLFFQTWSLFYPFFTLLQFFSFPIIACFSWCGLRCHRLKVCQNTQTMFSEEKRKHWSQILSKIPYTCIYGRFKDVACQMKAREMCFYSLLLKQMRFIFQKFRTLILEFQ